MASDKDESKTHFVPVAEEVPYKVQLEETQPNLSLSPMYRANAVSPRPAKRTLGGWLACSPRRTQGPWDPGTLEPWRPGTLEPSRPVNPGAQVSWNPGTLATILGFPNFFSLKWFFLS